MKNQYDITKVTKDMEKTIEQNSKGKAVDIVGLSTGGGYSIKYTKEHPEKVDHLVLLSGPTKLYPYVDWGMKTFNKQLRFLFGFDLGDDENVDNAMLIDVQEEQEKIKAKTFIYQCGGDYVFSEAVPDPKRIPNSERYIDPLGIHLFCLVNPLKKKFANERVLNFLDS